MSLAVVLFDRDGKLCDELAVEPYEHFKLMRQIEERDLPLLRLLNNYFEDTLYEPDELPQLLKEIREVLGGVADDDPLVPLLEDLRRLATSAYDRGAAVNIIGDYAYP